MFVCLVHRKLLLLLAYYWVRLVNFYPIILRKTNISLSEQNDIIAQITFFSDCFFHFTFLFKFSFSSFLSKISLIFSPAHISAKAFLCAITIWPFVTIICFQSGAVSCLISCPAGLISASRGPDVIAWSTQTHKVSKKKTTNTKTNTTAGGRWWCDAVCFFKQTNTLTSFEKDKKEKKMTKRALVQNSLCSTRLCERARRGTKHRGLITLDCDEIMRKRYSSLSFGLSRTMKGNIRSPCQIKC